MEENSIPYDDFPLIGSNRVSTGYIRFSSPEVSFSGKRINYTVCYVDMIDSTKIASKIGDASITLYYSLFLNSIAAIAKNFEARIIKNAGDCLIFYFPSTGDSDDLIAFKNVIECGITIIAAHRPINAKLLSHELPSMNYRISADHGQLEVARSSSSNNDDLFGSIMNLCAKINSKAPANGMLIGSNLYQKVRDCTDYIFEQAGEYPINDNEHYVLYEVKIDSGSRERILNPFTRTGLR